MVGELKTKLFTHLIGVVVKGCRGRAKGFSHLLVDVHPSHPHSMLGIQLVTARSLTLAFTLLDVFLKCGKLSNLTL